MQMRTVFRSVCAGMMGATGLAFAGAACPLLDVLQNAAVAQLEAVRDDDVLKFANLKDGREVLVTYRYSATGGAPSIRRDINAGFVVEMPRQYFLQMFGWADALSLCELNESVCAQLPDMAATYRFHGPLSQIPFMDNLVDDPGDHLCQLRTTAGQSYLETHQKYFLSGLLFIQLHEAAHFILQHGFQSEDDTMVSRQKETEADAAALTIARLAGLQNFGAGFMEVGLLPLLNVRYASSAHPAPECRVAAFWDKEVAIVPVEDCDTYSEDFTRGETLTLKYVDTSMSITDP